jgi:hypothetical protein
MAATSIRRDAKRETWELTGPDLDSETITVILAIEGNKVFAVTAFGGRHRP